jgi:hypothetical protein
MGDKMIFRLRHIKWCDTNLECGENSRNEARCYCMKFTAVLKISLLLSHVKLLLMAIRDFFVCGVVVFFDDSDTGYGLLFKFPTIILCYFCHKELLHFFWLDNTPKIF